MFADADDFPSDILLKDDEVEGDSDGSVILGIRGQRIAEAFFLQLHRPLDGRSLAGVRHFAGKGNVPTHHTLPLGRSDGAGGSAQDGNLDSDE